MIEKALKQLMIAIIEIAETPQLFSDHQARLNFDLAQDLGFSVYFDDGVFVNKDTQQDEDLQAFMANALPLAEFWKRNYGLSDAEVQQWRNEMASQLPAKPDPNQEFNFGAGDA